MAARERRYATTFSDLKNHSAYYVVLGRREAALENYLLRLPGKEQGRVVCMDPASTYRSLVRKHFRMRVSLRIRIASM